MTSRSLIHSYWSRRIKS